MNGNVVYSYRLRPGAEELIYQKISDITISMKAMDHLQMPELIRTRMVVKLSPEERAQYDKLKNDLVLEMDSAALVTRGLLPVSQLPRERCDMVTVPCVTTCESFVSVRSLRTLNFSSSER